MGWIVRLATVSTFAVLAVGSGPPVEAGTVDEQVGIFLALDTSPDLEPVVDVRLTSGGDDVTDALCTAAAPDPDDVSRWDCDAVPDGTYRAEVTGVPADAFVNIECRDALVNGPNTTDLVIDRDGGFLAWACLARVGRPQVILGTNIYSVGPPADGVTIALDPDVSASCVDDTFNGGAAVERCVGLALGEYDVVTTGAAEGELVPVGCGTATNDPFASGPPVVLTEEEWIWVCEATAPEPRARVELFQSGDATPDLATFAPISITGPDGDVTDRCTVQEDGDGFAVWGCRLVDGEYAVSFDDLPEGEVIDECRTIVLAADQTETFVCAWSIASEAATTTVGPTVPGSTLPDTGAAAIGWQSTSAAILIALGLSAVVASRRRGAPPA